MGPGVNSKSFLVFNMSSQQKTAKRTIKNINKTSVLVSLSIYSPGVVILYTLTLALIHPSMSSLQIPFSRWDWPNTEAASVNYDNSDGISSRGSEITSSGNKSPTILNSHSDHCNKSKTTNHNNHHHHHSHSHTHNHRSDIPLSPNCSHPKSNPIVASLSSLSAMLLEGQAVLAHQTTSAIWLFIGLNSGAIWKWTISLVRKSIRVSR